MTTPEVYDYTFDDLKSSGKTGLIRDSDIKRALYNYYAVLNRFDSWLETKRQNHARMTGLLNALLAADLRLWANNNNVENHKDWLTKKPNVEALLTAIRSQEGLKAALEGVKYTHERLIIESNWRITRAEEMLEVLDTALCAKES